MVQNGWWRSDYDEMFDEGIIVEYPFAPPGMLQDLFPAQVFVQKQWLNKTVRNWKAKVESVLAAKDPAEDWFFITYDAEADVHWGGVDSRYENRYIAKVDFNEDRICRIREWSNPFRYIWAAGREIPIFRVSLDSTSKIGKFLDTPKVEQPQYDLSPEACQQRRQSNIDCYLSTETGYAWNPIQAPTGYQRFVWFVPPEMKDFYDEEEVKFMTLWTNASYDSFAYLPGTKIFETEDPNEVFYESSAMGDYHWEGNHSHGGYMNRYLLHICLDEQGFCTRYDEYLNPINKMNSINKSIPSFPWLY